jgi:hypothetical protein
MIEPKEIIVDEIKYVIHKFPALIGYEIVSRYMPFLLSKSEDYEIKKPLLFKIMKFVGIVLDSHSQPLMLTTEALIDNHIKNWEILAEIESKIMEYNCSFFQKGRLLSFLEDIAQKSPV